MATGTQTVTNALFNATLQLAVVSPLLESFPFNLPLNFSDVTNLQVYNGTYTPNNDLFYLSPTNTEVSAPNFIIACCGSQMNLTLGLGNASTLAFEVQRFMFLDNLPPNSGSFIQSMFIDGRTVNIQPMAQGVPCGYSIITGQATIY